jgi:hypothetical protein
MNDSMVGLLRTAGEIQREELEAAQAAHEILDGRRRGRALRELPVRGRKRRKDRRELTRHLARVLARCSEEEFDATTRFADAAEQFFDAVHGAQATRRVRGA